MTRLARGLLIALILGLMPGCGLVGGDKPLRLQVMLADSAGLFRGNDVGVLGIPIGKVVSIEPQGDHVVASLEITRGDIKIPADAGAAIVARSVATDRYVELTPVYAAGPTIADGAVIPQSKTATPVDFDEVLSSLNRFGSGLMKNDPKAQNIRTVVDLAAESLAGNGQQFNTTLRNLASAVSTLRGQSSDAVATLGSLDRLTSALAKDKDGVNSLINNVTQALDFLVEERQTFGAALTSVSAAADDISVFVKHNRNELHASIKKVTRVLRNVSESRVAVGEALDTLPLAFDNIKRAQGANGALNAHLDPALFVRLGKALDVVCPKLGNLCSNIGVPSIGDLLHLLGLGRRSQ